MKVAEFTSLMNKHVAAFRGTAALAITGSEKAKRDPHRLYHQFRSIAPLLWNPLLKLWFVTGFDEASELLRSPYVGWGKPPYREDSQRPDGELYFLEQIQARWMLFTDLPGHARLRKLIHKAFSRWSIDDLRPCIQQIADELLDRVADSGRMNLVNDFAHLLPFMVMMRLMRIPEADWLNLDTWLQQQMQTLEVSRTPEIIENGNQSALALTDYFQKLVDERRELPQDDLISALTEVEKQGEKLNDDEIAANLIMLAIGGYANLQHFIGSAVWALFQHPEQLQALRSNWDLLPAAVEELLRYCSPTTMIYRRALQDFTFADQPIKQGQGFAVVLAAVNRDPNRFPEPDKLDLQRGIAGLSFGAGIHTCLGAQLARAEAEIALEALLRRFPNLAIETDEPTWLKSLAIRGLERLPITF